MFATFFEGQRISGQYLRIVTRSPHEALRICDQTGIQGFNITAPFKEAYVPFVDSLDPVARSTGVVNTVVRSPLGWVGHNTDVEGAATMLAKAGFVAAQPTLLLGAGGAARAMMHLLRDLGARDVAVVNRSPDRARRLVADLGGTAIDFKDLALALQRARVLISCISTVETPVHPRWLQPGTVVINASYRDRSLEDHAIAAGCPYLGGYPWLVTQGKVSFRLFFEASDRVASKPGEAAARPRAGCTSLSCVGDEEVEAIIRRLDPCPENVVLAGPPGAGKTSVGNALAVRLGWEFLDTDVMVQSHAGRTIRAVFDGSGEAAFRSIERIVLAKAMQGRHRVVAIGGGSLLNADNAGRIRSGLVVSLLPTEDEAWNRCRMGDRPLVRSRSAFSELFSRRVDAALAASDIVVPVSGRSIDEGVELIFEELHSVDLVR